MHGRIFGIKGQIEVLNPLGRTLSCPNRSTSSCRSGWGIGSSSK